MGHKINPDIFRLGVSKTWTFQFRTNRNFIKNLFLFKFLRNLFMNYTIPFFSFKKRRNQKFNDKLIFRGEDQVISSPFVKNNILFSHVYFGLLKNRVFIESFFIDVSFKQQRKKTENIRRNHLIDLVEFKPWNAYFYKTSVLSRFRKKVLKNKIKLKKIFTSRNFKFVNKKSKLFKYKPTKQLSKDFYSFLSKHNPKYYPNFRRYLRSNYKLFIKTSFKKLKIKGKKYRKIYRLRVFKKRKKTFYLTKSSLDYFNYKQEKKVFIKERNKEFKKKFFKMKTFFFYLRKYKRNSKRLRLRKGLRYLKKKKRFNLQLIFRYRFRRKLKDYKLITLPKLLRLISNSKTVSKEALSVKRALPKNPLYVFDLAIQNEKSHTFYKNYKNILTLKYFIRIIKFVKYFSVKKKIFFTENLISLLMNFIGLCNTTILIKRMFLILQSLIFYNLSYSFYNFINFKKKFFSKFSFFKGVSKTIHRTVIELTNHNQLSFSVVGQNKFRFNSSLVLNYILIKLGQYFSIHEIVNPLSYYIKGLTTIAGYKILITGRLTRKERAAVMIRSGKRMPLSTIKANIDYSSGFKIMKFGLVGIKVYLLLNPSHLLNLYKFKYIFN